MDLTYVHVELSSCTKFNRHWMKTPKWSTFIHTNPFFFSTCSGLYEYSHFIEFRTNKLKFAQTHLVSYY